jgi:hypothetical protein
MSPLEKLFRLEIEFHRRLRTAAPGMIIEAGSLHTSFAIQTGYEQLIGETGFVTAREIEALRERFFFVCDQRDVMAASGSVSQLLGVRSLVDAMGSVVAMQFRGSSSPYESPD